jgi:hypothetical protein
MSLHRRGRDVRVRGLPSRRTGWREQRRGEDQRTEGTAGTDVIGCAQVDSPGVVACAQDGTRCGLAKKRLQTLANGILDVVTKSVLKLV